MSRLLPVYLCLEESRENAADVNRRRRLVDSEDIVPDERNVLTPHGNLSDSFMTQPCPHGIDHWHCQGVVGL
jgi:hypothetical protein